MVVGKEDSGKVKSMQKDNVSVQSSEEVSYDTLVKAGTMLENREQFYIRQLCSVMDSAIERAGRADLSVLEIGFNNGERLRELCKIYPEAVFTGLEVREKPVEDMKALGYDCRLVETELFDEFFDSGEKFDIVYGFAVMHHMSDPYKSLESIIKILKPGGVLLFIREGHPYDLVSHLHTTVMKNWEFEKNTLKMKRKSFKKLLSTYTNDYSVKYDNNTLSMCFKRFNVVHCKLKLSRVPLWNGVTIFARVGTYDDSK